MRQLRFAAVCRSQYTVLEAPRFLISLCALSWNVVPQTRHRFWRLPVSAIPPPQSGASKVEFQNTTLGLPPKSQISNILAVLPNATWQSVFQATDELGYPGSNFFICVPRPAARPSGERRAPKTKLLAQYNEPIHSV